METLLDRPSFPSASNLRSPAPSSALRRARPPGAECGGARGAAPPGGQGRHGHLRAAGGGRLRGSGGGGGRGAEASPSPAAAPAWAPAAKRWQEALVLRSPLICRLSATKGSPRPVQRRRLPEERAARAQRAAESGTRRPQCCEDSDGELLMESKPKLHLRMVAMDVTILGSASPCLRPYHR